MLRARPRPAGVRSPESPDPALRSSPELLASIGFLFARRVKAGGRLSSFGAKTARPTIENERRGHRRFPGVRARRRLRVASSERRRLPAPPGDLPECRTSGEVDRNRFNPAAGGAAFRRGARDSNHRARHAAASHRRSAQERGGSQFLDDPGSASIVVTVALTRLMPKASVLLISTRWHANDLAGWLLRQHRGERCEEVSPRDGRAARSVPARRRGALAREVPLRNAPGAFRHRSGARRSLRSIDDVPLRSKERSSAGNGGSISTSRQNSFESSRHGIPPSTPEPKTTPPASRPGKAGGGYSSRRLPRQGRIPGVEAEARRLRPGIWKR